MVIAMYNQKPEAITYMPLPNGMADVWLHKKIKEVEVVHGAVEQVEPMKAWQAQEVYFRTDNAYSEIESNFDKYWNMYGYPAPTTEERIDALENALMEILEVL